MAFNTPQIPEASPTGGPPRRADQPRGMYPNPFEVEPPAPSPSPAPPIPGQHSPLPPLPPPPEVSLPDTPLPFPFGDGPPMPQPFETPLPGPGPAIPKQDNSPLGGPTDPNRIPYEYAAGAPWNLPPSPETSIEDLRDQAERHRRSMEDRRWQSLEPLIEQLGNQRRPGSYPY